jgi:hypothetical protein
MNFTGAVGGFDCPDQLHIIGDRSRICCCRIQRLIIEVTWPLMHHFEPGKFFTIHARCPSIASIAGFNHHWTYVIAPQTTEA